MRLLRTPDERFTDLPQWPFEPRYVEVEGIRIHHVDEGPHDRPPVLLLHGEPSWSYLYRTMIPVLVDAGHRVVAPDLVGFGRSDKPAEPSDHTYARHVGWVAGVIAALDLREVTVVGQDWGGLIGLRLVAEQPERFRALVAANTALPTGEQQMPGLWLRFRDFVADASPLPVGHLVRSGCVHEPAPEVIAAYDAPFPDETYKAGPRAMPQLVPTSTDDPAHPAQLRAWAALAELELPLLCAFSDRDPITAGADRPLRERVPGARSQPHTTISGAGHFLQEDAGPELARVVVEWLAGLER